MAFCYIDTTSQSDGRHICIHKRNLEKKARSQTAILPSKQMPHVCIKLL